MRLLAVLALAVAVLLVTASGAMARNVELLNGPVKAVGHSASGRAAVVQVDGGRRVLTLRNFRIDPGPKVVVWLVPKGSSGTKDHVSLGTLKGSRGNQSYRIGGRVDLRKYSSVVFWCVPFTQVLARADLRRS